MDDSTVKLCNVPNSSWDTPKGSSVSPRGALPHRSRATACTGTVSLIGLGLLGGSLGKAMLKGGLAKRVLGLVRREESIQQAQEAGIVHQAYLEPQEAVQEADLIILCTPVLQIPALMEKMLPHLRPGTLVTDVGSVKRELVDHLEPLLTSAGCVYIGSHPMQAVNAWTTCGSNLFWCHLCHHTHRNQS